MKVVAKNKIREAEQFNPEVRPWPKGVRGETEGDLDNFQYFLCNLYGEHIMTIFPLWWITRAQDGRVLCHSPKNSRNCF